MGTLIAIAAKPAHGAPMESRQETAISVDTGLDGDCYGTVPTRQVTVMSRGAWEAACRQISADLPWTTRRSNLLVENVELAHTVGCRLSIGEVVLEVTGETTPCRKMDAARAGLRAALTPDWRGGANCRVVSGGTVRVGDAAEISAKPPA